MDFSFLISSEDADQRLDIFLTRKLPQYNRSIFAKLIKQGCVLVNTEVVKAGYRLKNKDKVDIEIILSEKKSSIVPKDIPFPILYEDNDILILSKPPGIVVHPGAGNENNTLVNGLLYHCKDLPAFDTIRPGIIHRLDKNTSGAMIVAKSESALRKLTEDFKNRKVRKIYYALLLKCPRDDSGRLVNAIGRHPINRKKMSIRSSGGKYASTKWEILERFKCGMCFIKVEIGTGRTHQIRVHMASLGCPVVGDNLYGGKYSSGFLQSKINRQLLHAYTLEFTHPISGTPLTISAPLWPDMQAVLNLLRNNNK